MGSCLNQFLWNMINISQLVVPLCPMSAFVVGYGTSQLGRLSGMFVVQMVCKTRELNVWYVCGLNGMQDKRAECPKVHAKEA